MGQITTSNAFVIVCDRTYAILVSCDKRVAIDASADASLHSPPQQFVALNGLTDVRRHATLKLIGVDVVVV